MKMENDLKDILLDSLKHQRKETRFWKKMCIVLICFLLFLSCFYYAGFVWYESQYETTETKTIEVGIEGDNANAEYNDVGGDQYNDNATHSEGGAN